MTDHHDRTDMPPDVEDEIKNRPMTDWSVATFGTAIRAISNDAETQMAIDKVLAIRKLSQSRHLSNAEITQEDYNHSKTLMREGLRALGVSVEEIHDIIAAADATTLPTCHKSDGFTLSQMDNGYTPPESRINRIIAHRRIYHEVAKLRTAGPPVHAPIWYAAATRHDLKPTMNFYNTPTKMVKELEPKSEAVQVSARVHVTVVAEPIFYVEGALLLAQDDHDGRLTNIFVCHRFLMNANSVITHHCQFQPGRRMSLVNPYVATGEDKELLLMMYNMDCILHRMAIKAMCRWCGKANAEKRCSICKTPFCSKECQIQEYKHLKHKLICVKRDA